MSNQHVAIFSDLDGCLLNKLDYSFAAAVPTLQRIRELRIPLILASSKTEAEMRRLADEMEIADAPLICENGGVIFWSRGGQTEENQTVLGTKRSTILQVLSRLKPRFRFTSFEDMQVDGIAAATGLALDRANAALQRSCTEPLLWQDHEERLLAFKTELESTGLSLTRGGRFWHVAGRTDKGAAMQKVLARWADDGRSDCISVAIGDSPIDQGMLDVADYPIAIPAPDGTVHVAVTGPKSRIASLAGPKGWAETVSSVLNEVLEIST